MKYRVDRGIFKGLALFFTMVCSFGLLGNILVLYKANHFAPVLLILLCFLLRYPHEYLHFLAGRLIGLESTMSFKRLNATCTPLRAINQKELYIFALAPFFGIGLVLIIGAILTKDLHHVFFSGILIYHCCACYFDFVYVVIAWKQKNKKFRDHGLVLEILN